MVQSGKAQRYELATLKYKMVQQKKDRIIQMDSIITGKSKEIIVPKPGEFFVVSTTQTPSYNKKLLQTASFNLLPEGTLQKSQSQYLAMEGQRKLASQFTEQAIVKTDKRFKIGSAGLKKLKNDVRGTNFIQLNTMPPEKNVTVTSLQNELTRQMSQTAFNRQKDSQLNNFMQSSKLSKQESHRGLSGMQKTLDERLKETIISKQEQILSNPNIKTSMTTNIRNIMSTQDKLLLTASSRLLHAEVQQKELDHQALCLDPIQKVKLPTLQNDIKSRQPVSTIELLKQNRHRIPNQIDSPISLNKILPQENPMQSDFKGQSQLNIRNEILPKVLNRPSSFIMMKAGDQQKTEQVKEKFDIQNARKRDIINMPSNSYFVKNTGSKLSNQKWKDVSGSEIGGISNSYSKAKEHPVLVKYQQALIKEERNFSPFLVSPQGSIIESQKYFGVSQSMKILPGLAQNQSSEEIFLSNLSKLDQTQKNGNDDNLKFSNSIKLLKNLQNSDEKNTLSFYQPKKGSSQQLKDLLDKKKQNSSTQSFTQPKPIQQASEETQQKNNRQFLPVEVFDPLLGIEDPIEVIKQYRDQATGITLGLSKWNYSNGDAEFRTCIVEQYIKQLDLYEIVWLHNPSIKKQVSRFNLIFKLEDQDQYERRVFEAHKMREKAEILMKYNYSIENTTLPKISSNRFGDSNLQIQPQLNDNVKTRISYLIATYHPYEQFVRNRVFKKPLQFFEKGPSERYELQFFQRWQHFNTTNPQDMVQQIHLDITDKRYNLKLLAQLFKELDQEFFRINKQIWFECQLPYDKEKYETFKDILPKEKFIPVQDRIIQESNLTPLIKMPNRALPFEYLLTNMSKKLHQANQLKLNVLKLAQEMKQRILNTRLLLYSFTNPVTIEEFLKKQRIQSQEVLKTIQNNIFDCEYEVLKIITMKQFEYDKINGERRQACTHNKEEFIELCIPQEFMDDLKSFQRVLQYKFENTMREIFISTVEEAKKQLKFAIQQVEESVGIKIFFEHNQFLSQALTEPFQEHQIYVTSQKDNKIQDQKLFDHLHTSGELNLPYEDVIKICSDSALQTRILQQSCFQLQLSLEFNLTQKEIRITPTPQEWVHQIIKLLSEDLQKFEEINCILEKKLEPIHKNSGSQVFLENDTYPRQEIEQIAFLYQKLFQVPQGLEKVANQYNWIMQAETKKFKQQEQTVQKCKEQIAEFKRQRNEIECLMFQNNLQMGPFVIEVGRIKHKLLKKLDELLSLLFNFVKQKVMDQSQRLEDEVNLILKTVQKESYKNIEEVDQTRQFVNKMDEKFNFLKELISEINDETDFLDANRKKLSEEQIQRMWTAFARPAEIAFEQEECMDRLESFTFKFAEELKIMQHDLSRDIKKIQEDFDQICKFEDLAQYEEFYKKTDETDTKLFEVQNNADICNRRELLFGQSKTDFSIIKKLLEAFNPHLELWTLAKDYFRNKTQWMEGPISDLDGEQLPKDISDATKKLVKLQEGPFKDAVYTSQICSELGNLYLKFGPNLPIVTAFKNIDFKIRHFQIVRKLKDPIFEIEHDLSQSVNDLLRMGVLDYVDEIVEISEIATKERQLESQLNKMRDEWKTVKFTVSEFKDSESGILQGVEPIRDLLNEHIQKTMLIASSPYVKFFLQDVMYWKHYLVKVQEILEEWSKTQSGWTYLWTIFNSPDMQTQLPQVYQVFQQVDENWRIIMQQTQQSPLVLDCVNQIKVLENFQLCNEQLDKVTNSLNEYLQNKQLKSLGIRPIKS